MSSYLKLASEVLRQLRRPMTTQQILKAAYQLSLVPKNLYGKTQHKTLHARIAEDIRRYRGRSAFVRTDPGKFFLRTLLMDSGIPEKFKKEYPASPRADQLKSFSVACYNRRDIDFLHEGMNFSTEEFYATPFSLKKLSDVNGGDNKLYLRIFVITKKSKQIVVRRSVYGLKDTLGSKISIGSIGFVKDIDKTIFSKDALGLVEASLRTLSEQLDMDPKDTELLRAQERIQVVGILTPPPDVQSDSIAAIAICHCPDILDPIARYSGGGSLYWQPINAHFNDLESLDPWSRAVLSHHVLEVAADL